MIVNLNPHMAPVFDFVIRDWIVIRIDRIWIVVRDWIVIRDCD